MAELSVGFRKAQGVTVVDLRGRLVFEGGAIALRDHLKGLAHSGVRKILLNLGEVSYMDSAGLGCLVTAYTSTQRRQGQLKLVNPTARVAEVLGTTKLTRVLEVYSNEPEALASFK